jgi:hypothetical protein
LATVSEAVAESPVQVTFELVQVAVTTYVPGEGVGICCDAAAVVAEVVT